MRVDVFVGLCAVGVKNNLISALMSYCKFEVPFINYENKSFNTCSRHPYFINIGVLFLYLLMTFKISVSVISLSNILIISFVVNAKMLTP